MLYPWVRFRFDFLGANSENFESEPLKLKIFTDSAELEDYRHRKRKEFEDLILRAMWIKYTNLEESQKDFDRFRNEHSKSITETRWRREVYNGEIANVPPVEEKQYRKRMREVYRPEQILIFDKAESWLWNTRITRVCHRDVKHQKLLVGPLTHQVKLCDYGNEKVLVKGEAKESYICAPHSGLQNSYLALLIYGQLVCVLAELLLGQRINISVGLSLTKQTDCEIRSQPIVIDTHITKQGPYELDLYLSNKHDELLATMLESGSYKKRLSLVIVDGFAVEITDDQANVLRSAKGVRVVEKNQELA
ncbi:hypothetical protein HHK36_029122 [Tetracentron sinense]|uniref:Uncharacterized protein n=1 Tax=Tetracentron sinense TaxID=13715 RepID=A0A835D455_TETSI|nr:hypothetical protein HHK36_029122 [Tetracentron sinense]